MTHATHLSVATEPSEAASATADHDIVRLLWAAGQLATALGMSERGVRKLDRSGRIPRPIRIGRSVRWRVDEIRAWLDAGAPSRDRWEAMR